MPMVVEVAPVMGGGAAPPRRMMTMSPTRSRSSNAPAIPVSRAPASARTANQAAALRPVTAEAATQGVEQGVGSFAKPDPMFLKQWTPIKFFVGQAERDIREQNPDATLARATAVYVANAMRVRLIPNASFEIKPTSEPDQTTGMYKTATWSWEVRPINDHSKVLEAEIKVFALNPDGTFGRFIVGYSKSVPVEVQVSRVDRTLGAIDTASDVGNKLTGLFGTWQKTIGALVALLGAVGLLAWKLGLRKAKPAE